jgi:hypothetical protein
VVLGLSALLSDLTSFFNKMSEVNSKAYGLVILSIFLDKKSYRYFPRKTRSNFTRVLCDIKQFIVILGLCALFSDLKRHFLNEMF